MKKIGKFVLWTIVAIVIVIDVLLTVYLLNFNQFNVAEFGDKSILIMTSDIDNYKKGDLLVVKKTNNIGLGDSIFFYNTSTKESIVSYSRVDMVNTNVGSENTYMVKVNPTNATINSTALDFIVGHDLVIGAKDDVKVYAGLGTIVGTLSSRWVFLFAIIMPILVLFLYQLYLLIQELKKVKK